MLQRQLLQQQLRHLQRVQLLQPLESQLALRRLVNPFLLLLLLVLVRQLMLAFTARGQARNVRQLLSRGLAAKGRGRSNLPGRGGMLQQHRVGGCMPL